MKLIPPTLCIAMACAAPLLGHGQAAAQNMAASQLDQLSDFIGDATCSGNFLMKPGHPTAARFHGERTLGDHWLVVRYDEDATASNSKPYRVTQYFSYDAKGGHFVDVVLDNSGSAYGAGSSTGWQGNSITFENTDFTSGRHSLFRDVFTRHSANEISHTGYARDKSGKWIKTDQEICHRI